ncbi:MAG: AMIN domain-containing protein [Firmicutes bacterium]|nr:AMIN domain-containing protein [Bacillota bacterium]
MKRSSVGLVMIFLLLLLNSCLLPVQGETAYASLPDTTDGVTAGQYLLAIETQADQGRLSYVLKIGGEYTYRSFLLENPARLVIDLSGIEPSPHLSTAELAGTPVKGVRVSRFAQDTTRVVFDLDFLLGYRLEPVSGQAGDLRLVFNATLKDISFSSASEAPEIYIDTSSAVNHRTDYLLAPHRLIIDLWDVTLTGPALTIPGDNKWVKNIRVSQFDPQTIRLVMEIQEPRNCMISADPVVPGRLVVKTVQELQEATWVKKGSGGELVIKSSGMLSAVPVWDAPSGKLLIDLPHTTFDEAAFTIPTEAPAFRLSKKDGLTVQVELPIPTGHQYSLTVDQDTLRVSIQDAPLAGKIIVLDPGHGGIDSGAISRSGLREKDLNFDVTIRLKQYLEDLGAQVLLTRDDDRYVWLYDRVAIANRVGAAVMISIHANNHDNSKIRGLEVWHHPEREASAFLAQCLAQEVLRQTDLPFRGIMASKDFVLPRETEMPTVIFEMGFISNKEEEKLLWKTEFREKIVAGLGQGLLNYFYTQTAGEE